MSVPPFLAKLRKLDREDGWLIPCPDAHASSGFAVMVKADESAARFRFTCLEATNGDLCGRERDLIRLLGLTEQDVRISDMTNGIVWLNAYDMKQVEWAEPPLLQVAFTLLAGRPGIGKGALVARWGRALHKRRHVRHATARDPALYRGRRRGRPRPTD